MHSNKSKWSRARLCLEDHDRHNQEDEVDEVGKQVDEVMQQIAKNRMASSSVDPKITIEFYELLAEQCSDMAALLREEHSDKEG